MLMLILGAVAIVAFVYCYLIRPWYYWKNRGVTNEKPTWIFGHTFGVLTHTERWTDMLQRLYNHNREARYTGMYHFHYPILVIKDIELLKQIAVKDFDHFTDHITFLPPDSDPLFEKNLFALKGRKWREMRALLSPSFTGSKMRSMFGLIKESAHNFIQYFLDNDKDLIVVEMKDTFSRFSTDVIATTACGVTVNSLAEPKNQFYLMGQDAIDFGSIWKNMKFSLYKIIPPIRKVLKVQLFSDKVTSFFRELIDETIKVREQKGVVRPDMIQLLLEARKGVVKQEEHNDVDSAAPTDTADLSYNLEKASRALSNEDITAQALVFFIAGFDSVSSLMCFTTYELALHQDIQDRLREEALTVWKACGGKLTYEALISMKYMDMVILETLRKWPTNIAVDRVCTKPYTIEATRPGEMPIHLQKDDALWLPTFAIHRDPDHYPNSERFDPERFNDENKGNIKPYTFIPFGLGPRNCIGSRFALLETKIIIFYILLQFELVPVEKTTIPMRISKKSFALNAESGFWLGFKNIKGDKRKI